MTCATDDSSPTASYTTTFLDVAAAIPKLLELLCPEHTAALLATSRQLRVLVHQTPVGIRLFDGRDLPLLHRYQWSQIQSLHLQQPTAKAVALMAAAQWPRLSSLRIDALDLKSAEVLAGAQLPTLVELQLPGWAGPSTQETQGFGGFISSMSAELLEPFVITARSGGKPMRHGGALWDVLQSFQHLWPRLTELTLGQDRWVQTDSSGSCGAPLIQLQLGRFSTHNAGIKGFGDPCWSLLCSLALRHVSTTHLHLLASASTCLPQLETLALQGAINADLTPIQAGNWPKLKQVELQNFVLISDTVTAITHSNWHCLQSLDFSRSSASGSAVGHLGKGEWPVLETLKLGSGFQIWDAGMAGLAMGCWPLLAVLHVPNCRSMSIVGLRHIVSASWPLLAELAIPRASLLDANCEASQAVTESNVLGGTEFGQSGNNRVHADRPDIAVVRAMLLAPWVDLRVLQLRGSGFTKQDLAPLLRKWPHLQTLL